MTFAKYCVPEKIPGDENGFAVPAFKLAQRVCENGDIVTLRELREFAVAEAKECRRREKHFRKMRKYFHINAAISQSMQAKGFDLIASRAGQEC